MSHIVSWVLSPPYSEYDEMDSIHDIWSADKLCIIEKYIIREFNKKHIACGQLVLTYYNTVINHNYLFSIYSTSGANDEMDVEIPWILLNKNIYTLILCAHKFDKGSTLSVLPNDMIREILHWL